MATARPASSTRIRVVRARSSTPAIRTRIWHGFINDTAAAYSIPYVGASQVLWGSDFPHIRSIGLEAQSSLSQLLGALVREDQEKVVGGNAAHVFNRD